MPGTYLDKNIYPDALQGSVPLTQHVLLDIYLLRSRCSARDNVQSSDNFWVIMPHDRSISYAIHMRTKSRSGQEHAACSDDVPSGIGENDSEVDHREQQRDEYVCMA